MKLWCKISCSLTYRASQGGWWRQVLQRFAQTTGWRQLGHMEQVQKKPFWRRIASGNMFSGMLGSSLGLSSCCMRAISSSMSCTVALIQNNNPLLIGSISTTILPHSWFLRFPRATGSRTNGAKMTNADDRLPSLVHQVYEGLVKIDVRKLLLLALILWLETLSIVFNLINNVDVLDCWLENSFHQKECLFGMFSNLTTSNIRHGFRGLHSDRDEVRLRRQLSRLGLLLVDWRVRDPLIRVQAHHNYQFNQSRHSDYIYYILEQVNHATGK